MFCLALQRPDALFWRQNLEGKRLTAKVFKNNDLCQVHLMEQAASDDFSDGILFCGIR
jgi:hypothetical protein